VTGKDLWCSVHEDQAVLAELTDRKPNVMYEVGLSHGIGKPVILVAQYGGVHRQNLICGGPIDLNGPDSLPDGASKNNGGCLSDGVTPATRLKNRA
jgi:hypothetical protein